MITPETTYRVLDHLEHSINATVMAEVAKTRDPYATQPRPSQVSLAVGGALRAYNVGTSDFLGDIIEDD